MGDETATLAREPVAARHARATELYEQGRTDEAVALLRAAIAEGLDPEPVNDLAVMLAARGSTGEARELLAALRRLAPEYADARQNLAALGPGADIAEARERFLGLVADAAGTTLPDNVDPHFWPYGQSLPDPAARGERIAAQLAVLERCSTFWRALGREHDRDLFLRLLAYRALGPQHVRLELEPEAYHRAVQSLPAQLLVKSSMAGSPGMPFEWQLHCFDLHATGTPARVVGSALPLASTYLLSQYALRDSSVPARPLPGDVAVDAGGCWGETALWLAHAVGDRGHVHTFEPTPANLDVLRANLGANPALGERVSVWEAPLGAESGTPVWFNDGLFPGQVMREQRPEGEKRTVECRTKAIDDLVASGELPRVDFLTVDVEGADLAVLQGAARTIREQRPRLAIACYHRPDDLVSIPDHVASLGVEYRWFLQCSTMTDVDVVAFAVPA